MKTCSIFASAILAIVLLCSVPACKKDLFTTNGINANVSGRILAQNGMPLDGATVTYGGKTATTNINGEFSIQNVPLIQEGSVVKCTKAGYKNGFRTLFNHYTEAPAVTPEPYIQIRLYERNLDAQFSAASGANLVFGDGVEIAFPANGIVKSDGTVYTGSVQVDYSLLQPDNPDLDEFLPGELVGVQTGGAETGLRSLGMLGVELTDALGNELNLAPGQTATIKIPVPADHLANAPATIPLWHLNEATGKWEEDGMATLQGNYYEGVVGHFSWWNCDLPANFIILSGHFISNQNLPLAHYGVKLTNLANGDHGYSYTYGNGYIQGAVYSNEVLLMEVFDQCQNLLYTQNIGPFASDTNLGDIIINLPPTAVTISGNVVDCNLVPVTYGNVYLRVGAENYVTSVTNGAFSFDLSSCAIGFTVHLTGFDFNTGNSGAQDIVVAAGLNNANDIEACVGLPPIMEYLSMTDAMAGTSIVPPDSINLIVDAQQTTIIAHGEYTTLTIVTNSNTIGSYPTVVFTYSNIDGANYITVNYTQFDPPGGYIIGTFEGVIPAPFESHHITGNFVIRRN